MTNKMNQNQLFSSGLEVANFMLSSGLLKLSCAKILDCYGHGRLNNLNEHQNLSFSLRWKAYQEANINIIVFITSPVCTESHLQSSKELISSTILKENFPVFDFLCNNGNSFSIHKAAITLFSDHFHELLQLKNQCVRNSNPLIVTGHSLGGSVASLFTLWMLESLDILTAKRPLCLTFGSPLVGDKGFQQAISEHPAWNSCFLHVAATNKDSIPRLFITSQYDHYKPFGTFLLCCKDGCTSENPEAVSELLMATGTKNPGIEEWRTIDVYGTIIEQLESMIICKGISHVNESMLDSLHAGTTLQLEAIRIRKEQNQQQRSNELGRLIKRLEELKKCCMLNKRKAFDPAKKLNNIKINMVHLEWYKKVAKSKETGYYDCYKNQFTRLDRDIIKHKKCLTNYWKEIIADAEKMPQKQLVYLRPRWMYAGTTYRRMIEPLDIADYYRNGGNNYVTSGRSDHYIKLQQWLEEDKKRSESSIDIDTKRKQNVDVILTDDSCFWAHVEEAQIWYKSIERESSRQKLKEFEVYVMEQIKKSAVSSEIFLKGSSFMQWWKEYEKVIEPYHNSPLMDFMKNCKFQLYASGCLALN